LATKAELLTALKEQTKEKYFKTLYGVFDKPSASSLPAALIAELAKPLAANKYMPSANMSLEH
jgi:hypothetical protein